MEAWGRPVTADDTISMRDVRAMYGLPRDLADARAQGRRQDQIRAFKAKAAVAAHVKAEALAAKESKEKLDGTSKMEIGRWLASVGAEPGLEDVCLEREITTLGQLALGVPETKRRDAALEELRKKNGWAVAPRWQAPKCAADLEAVLFPCKTMSYDEKRGSPELVTKGWEAVQRIQQKALEESLSKSLQAELELNAAEPALPTPKALPEEDADAPFGAALVVSEAGIASVNGYYEKIGTEDLKEREGRAAYRRMLWDTKKHGSEPPHMIEFSNTFGRQVGRPWQIRCFHSDECYGNASEAMVPPADGWQYGGGGGGQISMRPPWPVVRLLDSAAEQEQEEAKKTAAEELSREQKRLADLKERYPDLSLAEH